MDNKVAEEAIDILKRLSPQNQSYLMTLARVAEIAENGVKNAEAKKPCELSEQPSK